MVLLRRRRNFERVQTSECAGGALLNSFLRESIGHLRTHFLELLAGVEPFSRSKTGDREAPIGPKSCPAYICMFDDVFKKITEHFWTRSIELRSQVREKIVEKRGSRPSLSAELDHFWDPIGSVRNSLVCCLRLRRNLAAGSF